MAKKKSLFKKIFGKSKQPKDANSSADDGAAPPTGRVAAIPPKANKIDAKEPAPPAPQATASKEDNAPTPPESAILETGPDHAGSPRAATKSVAKVDENEDAPSAPPATGSFSGSFDAKSSEDAPATKTDLPPPLPPPATGEPETEDSAVPADAERVEPVDEAKVGILEASDQEAGDESQGIEVTHDGAGKGQGNEATSEGQCADQGQQANVKKDEMVQVDQQSSQMSTSPPEPTEKPKVEVGHDLNAEQRKWTEGLASPKTPSSMQVAEDLKKLGKLSDRKKAVEQAFNVSKGKANVDTPSPARGVSARRSAVEAMLQKQLDPKAFLNETKGDPIASPSPSNEGLASKKQWVLETLEKQNDPNYFLDQKKKRMSVGAKEAGENTNTGKDAEKSHKKEGEDVKETEENASLELNGKEEEQKGGP